jgi:hypothetical protein
MGILDEAIKEHLELKRQHGADQSELKQLEDEAFGSAERPGTESAESDAAAEAATEFMTQPGVDEAPESAAEQQLDTAEQAPPRREPHIEIADLQEAPTRPEPEEPVEEAPAMEHEAIPEPGSEEAEPEPGSEPELEEGEPEPEPSAGSATEERRAIADQPTELYDVEEEFASAEPRAPSEEELVEEEIAEPRLAPVDPLAGLRESDEAEETGSQTADVDDDDDFFDEKRLSDELDQALEAPSPPETEEAELESDEAEAEPEEEPEHPAAAPDEDVLEETPDFLEETPEDDRLWFEQKPPKDFDFDD